MLQQAVSHIRKRSHLRTLFPRDWNFLGAKASNRNRDA